MKKLLFALTLGVFLFSCKGGKYDKTIADYEQDLDGVKIDLKLKIIETEEIKPITVADSLAFYKDITSKQIEEAKYEYERELVKFEKDSIYNAATYPEHAESQHATGRAIVKILKSNYDKALEADAFYTDKYKGKDSSEVLSILVKCKYSIENPLLNNMKQEITNTYIMSPDGTVCYGKVPR